MSRPEFISKTPLPYDCSFRDKCVELLDRRAIPLVPLVSQDPVEYWVVNIGQFEIMWIDDKLVVYNNGVIWSDGVDPWKIEDHEAEEYEDMLDRLMVLDRLADV